MPSISPTNEYSSLMQKREVSPSVQHTDGGIKVRQAMHKRKQKEFKATARAMKDRIGSEHAEFLLSLVKNKRAQIEEAHKQASVRL